MSLAKGDQKGPKKVISRLAAFIIRPEGPIELVDLCSREELQLALFFWKENLGRNTGPATELGKLIWEPLARMSTMPSWCSTRRLQNWAVCPLPLYQVKNQAATCLKRNNW